MLRASIIIPTRNRCISLKGTLDSLALLNTKPDYFEIIVIDNGSTDETPFICKNFLANYLKFDFNYIYDDTPGLLTGRHRGTFASKGDILVFIDDDVRVDPQWMNALLESFEDPSIHLVNGPSRPLYETSPPVWLKHFFFKDGYKNTCTALSLIDFGDEKQQIDPAYVFGLNYAIRKSTLYACGGFHPDCIPKHLQKFQGDGETGLSMKVKERQFRALYHPGAAVLHEIPTKRMTFEYFHERYYYQGVCDSYTEIRENGNFNYGIKKDVKSKRSLYNLTRLIIRNFSVTKLFGIYLRHLFAKSYKKGYNFHQQSAKSDKRVSEWIKKKDYWDYRLPL